MVSITTSLGAGSGIDVTQLVSDLSAAVKAPKEKVIAAAETANKAKVSALADAANGIDTFAKALSSLISGGTLTTQPSSSDASSVKLTALAGSRLGGLSGSLSVTSLATAQNLVSKTAVPATNHYGAGQFTITSAAGKATTVKITAGDDSIAGVARAINASGGGYTASVITGTQGSKLVIKGKTGADNGFTVQATDAFADFAYSGPPAAAPDPQPDGYVAPPPATMSATSSAADAQLVLDGVSTTRATNSFSDLIPGVQVDLLKATGTNPVTIGTVSPTAAIRQAVLDYADAYNELKTTLDKATATGLDGSTAGALRNDAGVRDMRTQLGRMTSQVLTSGGSPATLAELGLKTARDGSLSVDTAVLDKQLATNPSGVEAMFNPTQTSSSPLIQITNTMGQAKPGTYQITDIVYGASPKAKIDGRDAVSIGGVLSGSGVSSAAGLSFTVASGITSGTITVESGLGGALTALRDKLRGTTGALTASSTSLSNEAAQLVKSRTKMEDDATKYKDSLTKAYSSLDSKVGAYKATQAYMTQQIAQWNKSDS